MSESSVQEFLADELEATGDVVRELKVPGASAAPWRTDGHWDDTTIDPQIIGEDITGRVDIAYHEYTRELEFLEVKEADWKKAQFAEQQLENYVAKGNEFLPSIRKAFRAKGHPNAWFDIVVDMRTERYAAPESPVEIDGQQVALAWCRPGVIVFKTLDVDNKDVHYCGVSDEGQTSAFLNHLLGKAEEMAARAMARRLADLGLGPVNTRLLLDKVRERLRDSLLYFLERAMKAACAAALELSAIEVLKAFEKMLRNTDIVDTLLYKTTRQGEKVPIEVAQAAMRTATVLTIWLIVEEMAALVFAL